MYALSARKVSAGPVEPGGTLTVYIVFEVERSVRVAPFTPRYDQIPPVQEIQKHIPIRNTISCPASNADGALSLIDLNEESMSLSIAVIARGVGAATGAGGGTGLTVPVVVPVGDIVGS